MEVDLKSDKKISNDCLPSQRNMYDENSNVIQNGSPQTSKSSHNHRNHRGYNPTKNYKPISTVYQKKFELNKNETFLEQFLNSRKFLPNSIFASVEPKSNIDNEAATYCEPEITIKSDNQIITLSNNNKTNEYINKYNKEIYKTTFVAKKRFKREYLEVMPYLITYKYYTKKIDLIKLFEKYQYFVQLKFVDNCKYLTNFIFKEYIHYQIDINKKIDFPRTIRSIKFHGEVCINNYHSIYPPFEECTPEQRIAKRAELKNLYNVDLVHIEDRKDGSLMRKFRESRKDLPGTIKAKSVELKEMVEITDLCSSDEEDSDDDCQIISFSASSLVQTLASSSIGKNLILEIDNESADEEDSDDDCQIISFSASSPVQPFASSSNGQKRILESDDESTDEDLQSHNKRCRLSSDEEHNKTFERQLLPNFLSPYFSLNHGNQNHTRFQPKINRIRNTNGNLPAANIVTLDANHSPDVQMIPISSVNQHQLLQPKVNLSRQKKRGFASINTANTETHHSQGVQIMALPPANHYLLIQPKFNLSENRKGDTTTLNAANTETYHSPDVQTKSLSHTNQKKSLQRNVNLSKNKKGDIAFKNATNTENYYPPNVQMKSFPPANLNQTLTQPNVKNRNKKEGNFTNINHTPGTKMTPLLSHNQYQVTQPKVNLSKNREEDYAIINGADIEVNPTTKQYQIIHPKVKLSKNIINDEYIKAQHSSDVNMKSSPSINQCQSKVNCNENRNTDQADSNTTDIMTSHSSEEEMELLPPNQHQSLRPKKKDTKIRNENLTAANVETYHSPDAEMKQTINETQLTQSKIKHKKNKNVNLTAANLQTNHSPDVEMKPPINENQLLQLKIKHKKKRNVNLAAANIETYHSPDVEMISPINDNQLLQSKIKHNKNRNVNLAAANNEYKLLQPHMNRFKHRDADLAAANTANIETNHLPGVQTTTNSGISNGINPQIDTIRLANRQNRTQNNTTTQVLPQPAQNVLQQPAQNVQNFYITIHV